MQAGSTIQIPKRVDPKRKQLVKELQNVIKKQNAATTTPKRIPSQDFGDYESLDTLKKKQHMDEQIVKDGKSNDKLRKQNDKNFSHNRSHQIPIRPPLNENQNQEFIYQDSQDNERTVRKDDSLILPNFSGFFPMLDQRLPNLKDPNLGIFTEKERLLISIQQKLDSYLLFVKENRKKKKGQFFSALKKTFIENYQIFLQFSHIKKILYVDSSLYSIQRHGEGINVDCLVDIKLKGKETDTKVLEVELKERKKNFPLKLFNLKDELKKTSGSDKVQIPEVKFEFEKTFQASKNTLKASLKSMFDGQIVNRKKIDKFFVLQNKESKQYQLSRKVLSTGIKRVETIIKKETEIDLALFVNKMFENKQLSQKEIETIIDQINIVYRSKNVANIVKDQLLEGLSKKLIMSEQILAKCIEIFVDISPKINKSKPFLKAIDHKTGRIIQIERSSMSEFRSIIATKQEWVKLFEFKVEMNDDYVKKKLQEERDKVFLETKDSVYDEVAHEIEYERPRVLESKFVKFDSKKVRPFESPILVPKQIEESSEEELDKCFDQDENVEWGIPLKQFKETQKIIRQAKKMEKKKGKSENLFQKVNKEVIIKENVQDEKREKTMKEKVQQKQQFKSTLSNSDEIFYNDEEASQKAHSVEQKDHKDQ